MNDHLHVRNQTHFAQAQGTPFTIPPLSDYFHHDGLTKTADDVLRGIAPPCNVDDATSLLLGELKQQCPELDETTNIGHEELKQTFKKWRESTSTSPSGRHLGHYRALSKEVDQKSDWPDDQPTPDVLLGIVSKILRMTLRHTHVLNRWKTIHNTMFQKEAGNFKIHRLRVIHIMEADLQAIHKIAVARRLIQHASKNKAIHPDQWGGAPGKCCIDVAIKKTMELMYCSMNLQPAVIQYNGAAACYDRIVENLANMSL